MLKPMDIFVLLALCEGPPGWTYEALGARLGVSTASLYRSLRRSGEAHLFDYDARRPRPTELLEFILHGMRYAFAVRPGETARGVPTGWGAPGLEDHAVDDHLETFVWRHPQGRARGRVIAPLHDAVPAAALTHPRLHRWLALCDALRLGGARERRLAARLLEEELM